MKKWIIVALPVLLLIGSDLFGQQPLSAAPDESPVERVAAQNVLLEREFQRLSASLDLETSKSDSAVLSLQDAKTSWMQFRASYCRAVSQVFGGAHAGEHDLKCQAKLAADLIAEMKRWDW